MLGRRSLNLELINYDPEIERTAQENLSLLKNSESESEKSIEMGEPLWNVDPPRTLRELFAPITTDTPSCIVLPTTNATHFDLKPNVIQILPTFNGLENEDPYVHVNEFLERCNTFKFQNFSDESVRLRLFPFSLSGRAKAWLHSNMPGSITSWEILLTKFYNKFFPISRINELRREISSFSQEEDKKFCESPRASIRLHG
jgi:hypothetical protein